MIQISGMSQKQLLRGKFIVINDTIKKKNHRISWDQNNVLLLSQHHSVWLFWLLPFIFYRSVQAELALHCALFYACIFSVKMFFLSHSSSPIMYCHGILYFFLVGLFTTLFLHGCSELLD